MSSFPYSSTSSHTDAVFWYTCVSSVGTYVYRSVKPIFYAFYELLKYFGIHQNTFFFLFNQKKLAWRRLIAEGVSDLLVALCQMSHDWRRWLESSIYGTEEEKSRQMVYLGVTEDPNQVWMSRRRPTGGWICLYRDPSGCWRRGPSLRLSWPGLP